MELAHSDNVWYIVAGVTILSVIYKLNNFIRLAKLFNLLPGLASYPIIGHLPLIRSTLPKGFPQNVALQQVAMGLMHLFPKEKFVKLWISFLPYIFIYSAESAESILSSSKEINKSREYNYIHSWLHLGLLTSTGLKWKKRRKMLTPTFHFRVLKDFQSVISEQSLVLVENLSKEVNKKSIDIMDYLTMCTLDIICETAMGVTQNAQNNKDSPYIRALHVMSQISIQRVSNPFYMSETLFGLTPLGRKYNNAVNVVHSFTNNVIKTRMSEQQLHCEQNGTDAADEKFVSDISAKKRLAFLDFLLQENRLNPDFTVSDIKEEVDTFMFEGHDTTAVGLSWCVYILGHNPHIQEKAYEEIDSVLGNKEDQFITEEELKELKYIDCVIKESQRMFPSVPFVGRELEKDFIFGNKLVPKSTTVFVFISALHRNPEYFPNPNFFDPSRFTTENCNGRHPYAYIPFSAGPRNCIGQRFAMNEEKTILVNLIRNFSWVSLDPLDKVVLAPNMVSRPIPGHRIQLFNRA